MGDGFAVAAELRQRWPDAFAALTELRWLHTNRSPSSDYRWSAPLIKLDADGAVREIRCANALRAYPDMPSDEIPRAYRALRRFMQRLRDPQFRLTFPLCAGDLIMFDNRRILHARNAFDASRGERHLQGCYLDRDELLSRHESCSVRLQIGYLKSLGSLCKEGRIVWAGFGGCGRSNTATQAR